MRAFILLSVLLGACTGDEPTDDTADGIVDPCTGASGTICTWIGIPGTAMYAAEGLHRLEATTYLPQDGVFGPDGRFFFIDFNNHRIRSVQPDDTVITQAGSGFLGDGIVDAGLSVPAGPALDFAFNHPTDLNFDPLDDTKLYVAAWHNSRITVLHLADTPADNVAEYECGTGARAFGGDGGPAISAKLDLPASLDFDDDHNLYIMDQANQLIRKVDDSHVISTYAGKVETRDITDPTTGAVTPTTKGWPGYAGDGGPVSAAQFHASVGQAADPSSRIAIHDGMMYVSDTENQVIRRIDLTTNTIELFAGVIETRSGDLDANPTTPDTTETRGFPGYADGDRLSAVFNGPRDIEVAEDGTVYVADTGNNCVRKIDPAGQVSTLAGVCGTPGFDGDNGPADQALLYHPYGVAIAPDGRIIIADSGNQVFRAVYP